MKLSSLLLFLISIKTFWCYTSQCDFTLCGSIGDVNSTIEESSNLSKWLFPRLKKLVIQDYFRIFQVNLNRKCKFWPDDSQCVLRDCQVEDCPADEVPQGLRESTWSTKLSHRAVLVNSKGDALGGVCADHDEESVTLGRLNPALDTNQVNSITHWSAHDENDDKQFCELSDELNEDMIHVDLLKNEEKYTGYKGSSAARVWDSIYRENCFENFSSDPRRQFYATPYSPVDTCKEKRLFYRVISGLQTSISIQLCYHSLLSAFHSPADFFKSGTSADVWGPNLDEFKRRFNPANEPQALSRLRNLFVTFIIELRALAKAAPLLRQETFYTGNDAADKCTREMVTEILGFIEDHGHVFNEDALFKNDGLELVNLKEEFRLHFRNITRIMDCVGCDKCKMWGKLQIQGIGTALKILFSNNIYNVNQDGSMLTSSDFQLRRTEIVSLFNSFTKLVASINYLNTFQEMMRKES